MVLTAAINVLVDFAVSNVERCAPDEQIKVYLALAETLPTQEGRAGARNLARAKSEVAALQLQFKNILDEDSR